MTTMTKMIGSALLGATAVGGLATVRAGAAAAAANPRQPGAPGVAPGAGSARGAPARDGRQPGLAPVAFVLAGGAAARAGQGRSRLAGSPATKARISSRTRR